MMQPNSPLDSPGRVAFLKSVFYPKPGVRSTKQMSCEVVFGSPSANCVGTGVCKISATTQTPSPTQRERNCRHVSAILLRLQGGNGVALLIAREMMCANLLRTQFRDNKLKLTELCPLPTEVTQPIALKIKALQPGEYTVNEINGFFRINFYQRPIPEMPASS